jgi:hypothetical protein
MSYVEQIYFLLAIGGILLVLEGGATALATRISRLPEWGTKIIAGFVVIAFAVLLWPKP